MTTTRTGGARRAAADRFAAALCASDPEAFILARTTDGGPYKSFKDADVCCRHCLAQKPINFTEPGEIPEESQIDHDLDCPWANAHHHLGRPLPAGHTGGTPKR